MPEKIYQDIAAKFDECCVTDRISIDPYLNPDGIDERRGISLIIRPTDQVIEEIMHIQKGLKPWLDQQYFYPQGDLHTTFLSVVPVGASLEPFRRKKALYLAALQSALRIRPRSLKIHYQGVVASDDAILIKGYPCDAQFQMLRNTVLKELRLRDLDAEISRRYVQKTAHITILRFNKSIPDLLSLQAYLKGQVQEYSLGVMSIMDIDLVENDWFLKSELTNRIARF